MFAAAIEQDFHRQLQEKHGFNSSQVKDASRVVDVAIAMAFNWQQLINDLVQYGLPLLMSLLSLFNLTPTPPPSPVPTT